MSLVDLKQQTQSLTNNAKAKPLATARSCEIVAQLQSISNQNGILEIKAKALFDGPFTQKGQIDTYVVREKALQACKDNLQKGVGSQAGSVLIFGGAWRDTQTNNMSIGWINTAVSEQKKQARMNGHEQRKIGQAFAQMPYLEFPNVQAQAGEPRYIRWGMTQDSARLPVEDANGQRTVAEFDRQWLCNKLRLAWENRQNPSVKINQWLPTFKTKAAQPCQSMQDLQQAVTGLLEENPYRRLCVRVSDGKETTAAYLPFKPKGVETGEYVNNIVAQVPGFDSDGEPVFDEDTGEQVMVNRYSLAEGIDNTLLMEAASSGQLALEVLPRENLLLSTKNALGMANDVNKILSLDSNSELYQLSLAFGQDPEAVSRVALVFQQQEDKTLVVAGPFRLDSTANYSVNTIPTPQLTDVQHTMQQGTANETVSTAQTPAEPTPPTTRAEQTEQAAPEQTEFPMSQGDDVIDMDMAIDAALDNEIEVTSAEGISSHGDPVLDRLFTRDQQYQLLCNGKQIQDDEDFDPKPVVKLFTPDAQAQWLVTELDPKNPTLAFGLCDMGLGHPEMGSFSLDEITNTKGVFVKRDMQFEARGTISEYYAAAHKAQEIVQLETARQQAAKKTTVAAPQL